MIAQSDRLDRRGVGLLIVLALARLAVHVFTNGNYGFHRDELAVLDDAFLPGWPVMCPSADVRRGDDRGLDLSTVRVPYPLGYAGNW